MNNVNRVMLYQENQSEGVISTKYLAHKSEDGMREQSLIDHLNNTAKEYPAHIREDGAVQTCTEHCRNVASETSKRLLSVGLAKTGYLAGLIHDCGKFSAEFREYIEKAAKGENVVRGSVIHSFAAVRLMWHGEFQVTSIEEALCDELIACACGSHHGLFDCIDENGRSGLQYRLNEQPLYDDGTIRNFYAICATKQEIEQLRKESAKEMKALTSSCLKSSRDEGEGQFALALAVRLVTSALMDADRLDTARFMSPERSYDTIAATPDLWSCAYDQLTTYLGNFFHDTPISLARAAFSKHCADAADQASGIYRLNLPTGGGKTLAGLRYALKHAEKYDKKRIFFVAPLLSILDQNAAIISDAVGDERLILEHHSDVIIEREDHEEADRYALLTDTWDSPIIITTLVQLLNTLFYGKTSSVRRFHCLADSVIVIDEVQSVPTSMLSLFNLAMNFLSTVCHTTVVLCSATQPEFGELSHPMKNARRSLINDDETARYASAFKRSEMSFHGRHTVADVPAMISELLQRQNSVLVVCNKKDEASSLFSMLSGIAAKKYHLSAGMCMAHRKVVLNELKADLLCGRKAICISTQVIEAGIDISFDAVIRFAAGLDNVVQAAGRCNRNGTRAADSPVWIVDCMDENLSRLTDIKRSKDALIALTEQYRRQPQYFENDLASPKAVELYYQTLYRNLPLNHCDFPTRHHPSLYSMLSENEEMMINERNDLLNQAFKTAGTLFNVFDSDQQSVVVPWGEGKEICRELCAFGDFPRYETLEKAKQYTVSVFQYQFDLLMRKGALLPLADGRIYVLNEMYYDPETGIKSIKEGEESCDTLMW